VKGRLKVVFVPDYRVSVAERLIPASDVSEQISTAGYEASGTSNMKFMMNGALTIGTRDGATIEMAEAAGEETFFLFGLTAEQVAQSRGYYNPRWHYENEPETRAALDLIRSNHFSHTNRMCFAPFSMSAQGDHYLAPGRSEELRRGACAAGELYTNEEEWGRKAVLNIAASGRFSSDRTIEEYAKEIWKAEACPME
jgi:starch phosphorylase